MSVRNRITLRLLACVRVSKSKISALRLEGISLGGPLGKETTSALLNNNNKKTKYKNYLCAFTLEQDWEGAGEHVPN